MPASVRSRNCTSYHRMSISALPGVSVCAQIHVGLADLNSRWWTASASANAFPEPLSRSPMNCIAKGSISFLQWFTPSSNMATEPISTTSQTTILKRSPFYFTRNKWGDSLPDGPASPSMVRSKHLIELPTARMIKEWREISHRDVSIHEISPRAGDLLVEKYTNGDIHARSDSTQDGPASTRSNSRRSSSS